MSYLEALDPILRIFHSQAAWICCTSTSSCWTFVVSPCRSQGWTNRYRLGQIENGGQETNCTMWKQWQILENFSFSNIFWRKSSAMGELSAGMSTVGTTTRLQNPLRPMPPRVQSPEGLRQRLPKTLQSLLRHASGQSRYHCHRQSIPQN